MSLPALYMQCPFEMAFWQGCCAQPHLKDDDVTLMTESQTNQMHGYQHTYHANFGLDLVYF